MEFASILLDINYKISVYQLSGGLSSTYFWHLLYSEGVS